MYIIIKVGSQKVQLLGRIVNRIENMPIFGEFYPHNRKVCDQVI